MGGAELASACIELDLIDECWLYVHPAILGAGKPMLSRLRDRIKVELAETHTFRSGVILLRYRRIGDGH